MLLFAYGSNMDMTQMKDRCPTAEFVCIAELRNHRLAFTRKSNTRNCGVADAVPDPSQSVWGVVYHIDEKDIEGLDRLEGLQPGRRGNSYRRDEVQDLVDGDQDPPSAQYKDLILTGARHWHLPGDYLKALEAIVVSVE